MDALTRGQRSSVERPVQSPRIPLFDLDYGPAEADAVAAVLASRWLTMGTEIAAFEQEFAARHGVRHAIAVNNCTAALQLAYRITGVGPNDEVIVPSLTFAATANAAASLGAIPVFADVTGEDDLGLSPASVERLITPRTRAVTAVHYAGFPADVEALAALCERRRIALIEDCAHSPGVEHNGCCLGAWGRVGCFSFFSNKNLSTGEGGMLTTNDDELAVHARLLRSHGMTTLTLERHRGHAFSYDVLEPGYNFRMDEIHAALGRVQLAKLDRNNARRRTIAAAYRHRLAGTLVHLPYGRFELEQSSAHIMPVILPAGANREAVMAQLRSAGIQTSIHYPPLHRFECYRASRSDAPLTEDLAGRLLTLPLYPAMTSEQVDEVCDALLRALNANPVPLPV